MFLTSCKQIKSKYLLKLKNGITLHISTNVTPSNKRRPIADNIAINNLIQKKVIILNLIMWPKLQLILKVVWMLPNQ